MNQVSNVKQVALEIENIQVGALADDSEHVCLPIVIAILDEFERKHFNLVKTVAVRHLVKQVFRYGLQRLLLHH